MAEKEIVAQIDKLRKTRPARALTTYAMAMTSHALVRDQLADALSFLRDDLKEEIRLVEQAKVRSGTSIIKDRMAVSGWLELFVAQLGRESDTPATATPSSPAPQRTEPVTSHDRLNAFAGDMAAQGKGELIAGDRRCAAQDTNHDTHTWLGPKDPETGSSRWRCWGGDSTPTPQTPNATTVADYLSGKSDQLDRMVFGPEVAHLDAQAQQDAAAYIGDALEPAQQDAHATIDQELAHVTADPFAPIPTPAWTSGPVTPPGGEKWTAANLLAPIDVAFLPPHLSFSQVTTLADCGAKWRMQRVANLPQVPQWANVGGKAFHAAVELIERKQTQLVAAVDIWPIAFEAQIVIAEGDSGMPRQQFRASNGGKEGYDWWRVEGASMLARYVAWRQGDGAGQSLMVLPLPGGGNQPALEWELTYDVDGVPFKTILDSVWIDRSGDTPVAIIRDWKTGSLTPDDRQLCTQAWGLRKAGCPWDVRVQFFDARKGTFTEPFDPFERMTWDDVRYFVLSADAQRKLPIQPARPSDFCGGCPVAYACPIMAQRKAPKAVK